MHDSLLGLMGAEILISSLFSTLLLLIAAYFRRHLRQVDVSPPSPPSFPLIGHLYLLKSPLHRSLVALSAKYGPIISLRFGSRPVLLISSASAAEECFSKNDLAFANRPRLLAGKHLGYDYTTLVWAPYGSLWRNLRRITTLEIFSASRLDSLASVREEEVAALVKALADDSRHGRVVEVRHRLFELNLNLMMRFAAGKRFCGEGKEEEERFQEVVEESFAVSGATNFSDFLPVLRWVDYKGFGKKLVRLQKKRDAFMQDLVNDRRRKLCSDDVEGEDEMPRKCLIDVLLCMQKTDPERYRDEIIKGVAVTLLSAGTDTSALTTEWALALLLTNPIALSKAQAEIHQRVGHDRLINESDLSNLPYLHNVIKEAQRLHPVAPIIPAHESVEDCTVNGFHVPRGTMLLVNIWAIQREPHHWDEPEAFRPERWSEEDESKRQDKTFFFGMGRRRCPGEGLALRVVGLMLGALLQCFKWEAGDGEVDLSEGSGLSMPMAKPLKAICEPQPFLKDGLLA